MLQLMPRRVAPVLFVLSAALPAMVRGQTPPAPAAQPPVVTGVIPAAQLPAVPAATPVPVNAVAATVNGQTIPEAWVQCSLRRVPPEDQAKARPEIIDFLVENILVDQHLIKQGVQVDDKEIADRLTVVKDEVKKGGQDFAKMLAGLGISEDELKEQLKADLRWEKFSGTQATDAQLQELFAKNAEMFDGTLVRARHILLEVPNGDPAAVAKAKEQLAGFRKQIDEAVAAGMTKLPPTADNLAKEQERQRLLDIAFGTVARKESNCPSAKEDGDITWFPRAGSMVEAFAATAFALPPFQMSEPVVTPWGVHLILVTGRRPGKPVKFEDTKDEVREVFCNRLREDLVSQLRPTAQVVVTPVKP